jgi:hypothetical protein
MIKASKCTECGAELPLDAPQGLCPRCLLRNGVGSTQDFRRNPPQNQTLVVAGGSVARSAPGATLRYFGDYELLDKIAEGGMGVVWKARQVSLNRLVAVKTIRAGRFASGDDVGRFHTEAEAAANLQHPNIVAIHEVGEQDGQHYFSMDHVEGKNLAELVRDGPLPAEKAAALLKTIASAIHYAHQRGTLHRDLKPSNVLVDAAEQPRITDFGLAKQAGRDRGLTQTGAVMGTPAYMPPEQAAGRHGEFGPASDVYSLGAILYELLTGRAPFRGATPMETMLAVLEQEPVPPRKLNPQLPPDLETICLKCLEKRPERRYPTARELAEELERFLNHDPIFARPAGVGRKAWVWVKAHPWVLAGAASLVIMGLLFLAYGLWAENRLLVWEKTHPGYQKKRGVMARSLETAQVYFFIVLGAGYVIRGLAVGRILSQKSRGETTSPAALWVLGWTGAVLIISGVILVLKRIDVLIWETHWQNGVFIPFFAFTLGIRTLWIPIREHQTALLGYRVNDEMIKEEWEEIDEAIFANDSPKAIKFLQSFRAGTTLEEAEEMIDQRTEELREAQPKKFKNLEKSN